MAVHAVLDDHESMTRADIAQWVQEYVDQGIEPLDASATVIEDIIRDGLADEFVRLTGRRTVHDEWRKSAIMRRPAAVIGRRRVEPSALRTEDSLLEAPYRVDGRWIALGDMDKAVCKAASKQYEQASKADAQNAKFLARLADSLKAGQTVRQTWDHERLLKLFELSEAA